MSIAGPAERGGFPWLLAVLTLVALAILLALGTWQVRRLAWKEALIATIDARIASAPVPLADLEAALAAKDGVEYRPVIARGQFDHAAEQYFLATHGGQSGWFVYTPLRLDDGRAVFVNRGFVPYDRRDPATRAEGQIAGTLSIEGLAREAPTSRPSWIVPDNDPAKRTYYWKDSAAMATGAGLDPARVVPLFIDAGDAPNPGGLPVGGVTIVDLPNSHLQYAVTWYGLAAALAAVAGLAIWRRMRPARP